MAQTDKIQKLEENIRGLEVKRVVAETQLGDTTDKNERTAIKQEIRTLSEEITAKHNTLNLLLEAQKQGKFLLSFSFFPVFSLIFFYQFYFGYCCLMYRLDRFEFTLLL